MIMWAHPEVMITKKPQECTSCPLSWALVKSPGVLLYKIHALYRLWVTVSP